MMREVANGVHVIVGMCRRLFINSELALSNQVDDSQLGFQ